MTLSPGTGPGRSALEGGLHKLGRFTLKIRSNNGMVLTRTITVSPAISRQSRLGPPARPELLPSFPALALPVSEPIG